MTVIEVLEKYQRILNLPLMEGEDWRVLKENPRYIITSYGRVFNTETSRELKPIKRAHKTNYRYVTYSVTLSDNGKHKAYDIHRLVAKYFIPYTGLNPDNTIIEGKPQINHIDENTFNNHADNLQWCDSYYNNKIKSCNKYSNMSIEELIELRKQYPVRSMMYYCIGNTIYKRRKRNRKNIV